MSDEQEFHDDIIYPATIPFVLVHLACLAAIWTGVTTGAVITCIALYVQQFCAARGLPHEGMRVELEQHGARNPNRIGRFAVKVVLPEALPAHYQSMLEQVARSCPAHHTLENGAEVEVTIEAGATAEV